jgi:hypothetical protein
MFARESQKARNSEVCIQIVPFVVSHRKAAVLKERLKTPNVLTAQKLIAFLNEVGMQDPEDKMVEMSVLSPDAAAWV